ncbi:MAG: methyltransferase domain-containing protein [Gemmatimonadota bacterium]
MIDRPALGRDAYADRVSSESYREERAAKADVVWRLCGEELRRAARIADLGSGTGLLKRALEKRLGREIYGFELDPSFVHWRGMTVMADVRRLPAPDDAFDFLLLNHLYEHVADQPALFREAYRVLAPGGRAYLSAGNVLAVLEPHYRLPFLSWLPRPLASAYLRATGRGRAYRGIRFRTHGALVRMVTTAGFRHREITEEALERLLAGPTDRGWQGTWRVLRRLPGRFRGALLRSLSPQWFFLLEKPPVGGDPVLPANAARGSRRAPPHEVGGEQG